MDNEVIKRHKKRWCEGENQANEHLNDAISNFNSLVDNMEAPSVHKVQYTIPLDYDIENRFEDNVLISDISRQEQIKDLKLLHVKLDSDIDSGSLIFWNDEEWIVSNEEYNTVQSHKTYTIQKCGIDINVQFDGSYYTYPVTISNLTIYSDGEKELVNLTLSSAKYSIQIVENEITNAIDVDTRFIIRGRAFSVSAIDDFTVKNIRTLTVVETVANSFDDLESDIAWNEDLDIEDVVDPNMQIAGDDFIYIGGTSEYEYSNISRWELEKTIAATIVSVESGKCKIKCVSDSNLIGEKIILYALDSGGNILKEKYITIRGLF